jgi:hypothetical protein
MAPTKADDDSTRKRSKLKCALSRLSSWIPRRVLTALSAAHTDGRIEQSRRGVILPWPPGSRPCRDGASPPSSRAGFHAKGVTHFNARSRRFAAHPGERGIPRARRASPRPCLARRPAEPATTRGPHAKRGDPARSTGRQGDGDEMDGMRNGSAGPDEWRGHE